MIGFSSRINYSHQAPVKFDVIGSNDPDVCKPEGLKDPQDKAFHLLLAVEKAGFTSAGEPRSWIIPKEKQAFFTFIGFKIYSSKDKTEYIAAISKAKMWRKQN